MFPMSQLSAFWSQVQAGLSASERPLCPDRRRADGASKRRDRSWPAGSARSIDFAGGRFSLQQPGAGAGRLRSAHPAGRERRAGRPHRRGQEQPGQADRPFLRVSGRPDQHRRPRHPRAGPAQPIAASWASWRRPPSSSPARWPTTSAMPARRPATSRSWPSPARSAKVNGWIRCPTACTPRWASAARG
jgi:hypothetical protein